MPAMKSIVAELSSLDTSIKIMVGGAPITQEFADQIGADGYSVDATSAVELAQKLCA